MQIQTYKNIYMYVFTYNVNMYVCTLLQIYELNINLIKLIK